MVSTDAVAAKPRCAVQPFFLDTPRGPMFAVHRQPADAAALRGHVLVVAGFNEEMNRCRSMLTLLAEHLAALGFGTLVIDLHGTGDSAGGYVDGRWEAWRDDIALARAWLDARPGGCVALLGVRLGAMLAAEALRNFQQHGRRIAGTNFALEVQSHHLEQRHCAVQRAGAFGARETVQHFGVGRQHHLEGVGRFLHCGQHEARAQALALEPQGIAHGIECAIGAIYRQQDFHGSSPK